MMWIKINNENKPKFGKQYLLGRQRQGFFAPEQVYFGYLYKIETKSNGDEYIYRVEKQRGFGKPSYSKTSDITHFIEIDDLPNIS